MRLSTLLVLTAFSTSVAAAAPPLRNSVCEGTPYPETCVSAITDFSSVSPNSLTGGIIASVLKSCLAVVEKTLNSALALAGRVATPEEQDALEDCTELLDITNDQLNAVITDLSDLGLVLPRIPAAGDINTFLSASRTNQETCIESLGFTQGLVKSELTGPVIQISQLVGNSLALVAKIGGILDQSDGPRKRSETGSHNRRLKGFPGWVKGSERRILQASQHDLAELADVTVALDGSADYTRIGDAIQAAPDYSPERYVIYVKAGVYDETLDIKKKKVNITLVGEGKDVTVITAHKNVVDRSTTFRSATVAVTGSRFIARGVTFENTAGPTKHQAVALRSGSDMSVFYQCSFKGYQDTLYAHSLRQFYSDCDIYGTVDFIFGNAAVVFQNCRMLAREALDKQLITVTAQGRDDPNQNTGTSIQNCNISADTQNITLFNETFPSYLGRPWRQYSRTVIMESYIDANIRPEGWVPWNESDFALNTLYYGEYANRGPSAVLDGRVQWAGFHGMNSDEANQFTVAEFIDGNAWLPSTGVRYNAGLNL